MEQVLKLRYYCESQFSSLLQKNPHIRKLVHTDRMYRRCNITDARMIACAQLHQGHLREPCLLEHVSQREVKGMKKHACTGTYSHTGMGRRGGPGCGMHAVCVSTVSK